MAVAVASKATDKVHQTIGADYNSQRDNLNLVGFKRTLYEWSMHLPAPYELGTEFPLALSPTLLPTRLSELVAAVKKLSASGVVRVLLTKHGAIYFRDVGVQTAADFSQFAAAFGWPAHEDIGNPVRRTVLAPNVATANEGPNTQPIYPHNEFGLSPHYPQYVLFYCAGAPEQGGETPINSSIVLYERLKETGVKYQLLYPKKPRDNVSSPGTSVLQSYGKKILDSDGVEDRRAKIEKEIKRLPTATWQWENQSESNQLGDLRVWQRLPALQKHEMTGHMAFFNNMVSRFLYARANGTLQPSHISEDGKYQPPCFYGDGELIPEHFLVNAYDIIQKTSSKVTWQAGDVLILDNHQVQHAREPWTGPRKLLASCWD